MLYLIRTIYKQIQRVTVIQQKFAHHHMHDLWNRFFFSINGLAKGPMFFFLILISCNQSIWDLNLAFQSFWKSDVFSLNSLQDLKNLQFRSNWNWAPCESDIDCRKVGKYYGIHQVSSLLVNKQVHYSLTSNESIIRLYLRLRFPRTVLFLAGAPVHKRRFRAISSP